MTPPLDGLILPGVTRDSLLALSREWGEFQVSERDITMAEVVQASHDKKVGGWLTKETFLTFLFDGG